jgi:hypothetical protein
MYTQNRIMHQAVADRAQKSLHRCMNGRSIRSFVGSRVQIVHEIESAVHFQWLPPSIPAVLW